MISEQTVEGQPHDAIECVPPSPMMYKTLQQMMEDQQSALKIRLDINKPTIFKALVEANIKEVIVYFDGEGDSGQINEIQIDGQYNPHFSDEPSIRFVKQNEKEPQQITLREALDEMTYDALQYFEGGWDIGSGSFGEITIDTSEKTILVEFNQRIMNYASRDHELKGE